MTAARARSGCATERSSRLGAAHRRRGAVGRRLRAAPLRGRLLRVRRGRRRRRRPRRRRRATIAAAEALLGEWTEIEAVVPSMDAWISLAPSSTHDDVTVDRRPVAGAGHHRRRRQRPRPRRRARAAPTSTPAARSWPGRGRAGRGRRRRTSYVGRRSQLDDFEQFDATRRGRSADLERPRRRGPSGGHGGPRDALLPEPLPGEGVAYEGESITGVVDGRTFEARRR